MAPRFVSFYMPVLRVLQNIEVYEVNELIEKVASEARLSPKEREVMTRKGTRPQYQSNIWWAITDLKQGGFIETTKRASYRITIDGLELLENHPDTMTREYLAEISPKFLSFLNRKGTRPRISEEAGAPFPENVFENISSQHKEEYAADDIEDEELILSLKEMYDIIRKLRRHHLSTAETEEKATQLEERLIRERILPMISEYISPALEDIERELVLVVQYTPDKDTKVSLSRSRDIISALDAKEITTINKHNIVPSPIPQGKRRKYRVNGSERAYFCNETVQATINAWLAQNPKASFSDLEQAFPAGLQGRGHNVVRTLDDIQKRSERLKDDAKRWFHDKCQVTSCGTRFGISTQWDYRNFAEFRKRASLLGIRIEEA